MDNETTSTYTSGSVPISKIKRTNAEWEFYHDTWDLLECLYAGGAKLRANVDKFVIRRPKELYDVFYERVRRLTYQDILQACISWHLSKMFQEEPVIDGNTTNKDFASFLENCDRSGTSFNRFSRNMLEKMMLFQRAFVLIDKPKSPVGGTITTRQQEIDAGVHMPYLVLFDPRNVINWGLDDDKNLDWIVIKTMDSRQEGPLGDVEVYTNWTVYDKSQFYRYRHSHRLKDGESTAQYYSRGMSNSTDNTYAELIDSGPHSMSEYNRVPVDVVELPMDLWHANRAFLHLLEHVDVMNAYSWKLFMANLPQLVIWSEDEPVAKTLTESGFIWLNLNDKIEWLEPKGGTFQESRMHLSSTRQEIYRAFHLQAQAKDSTATADGSSGYSKEVEMAPAVDILNALGDIERACMQTILTSVKLVGNMGTERPDVNGFQFETRPVHQMIAKYQAGIDSGIIQKSPILERTVAGDIAMALVDGKNPNLKSAIMKEIEASPVTPVNPVTDKNNPSAVIAEFQSKNLRANASNTLVAEGVRQA
jgi:hypothetical protein